MYSDYGYSILYNLLVEEKTSWNAVSIKQVALFANHHSWQHCVRVIVAKCMYHWILTGPKINISIRIMKLYFYCTCRSTGMH